jgi:hypothetical protein
MLSTLTHFSHNNNLWTPDLTCTAEIILSSFITLSTLIIQSLINGRDWTAWKQCHYPLTLPPSFPSRILFFALKFKFWNVFFEFFLPWIRTSECVSQNFAKFELEKFRKMCSEVFIQEQNQIIGGLKRVKGGEEKNSQF